MNRKNIEIKSPAITVSLLIFATILFIVLNRGIDVGTSNHVGLIPVVRRILDPLYLPGDFAIDTRWHHHKHYTYLVALFSLMLGEVKALVTLKILATLFLATSLWQLCRTLGMSRGAFMVVVAMVATNAALTGSGLEMNNFIGSPEVNAGVFANALILLAVAQLVDAKNYRASLLLGLATLSHVQIGIVFSVLMFPAIIATCLYSKESKSKVLLISVLLWAVPVSIALLPVLSAIEQGGMTRVGYFEYLEFRMPHHFEIRSYRKLVGVLVHAAIVAGVYMYFEKYHRERSRGTRVVFYLTMSLIVAAILHFVDYYVMEWGYISALQTIRLSPFITLFGAIMLILLLQEIYAAPVGSPLSSNQKQGILMIAGVFLIVSLGMQWGRIMKTWDPGILIATEKKSDWVDITRWVNENGARNTTYLSPPGYSGFTYLAERSSVVEFKLNPDGARYLAEWKQRLTDLSGGELPSAKGFKNRKLLNQRYFGLSSEELFLVAKKYDARFAIVHANYSSRFEPVYRNSSLKLIALPVK